MKKILALLSCIFICCQNSSEEREKKIQKIKMNPEFVLFHQSFFQTNSIPHLKKKYPYLFPNNIPDSIWIAKKNIPSTRALYQMSRDVFGDFKKEEHVLTNLFKHIKYYEPNFVPPKTLTLITDLDDSYPVIYADSLLLIGVDLFLGRDAAVYKMYPKYLRQTFDRENLPVKVAEQIISKRFKIHRKRKTFLDNIIGEGKKLYIKERLIPAAKEKNLIGYGEEKLQWAKQNERNIWLYFIDHNLLYSTDTKLLFRFINPAPFSKFYTESDTLSPGRIGAWIGWQIVRYFMQENQKVSLKTMLEMDATTLFEKSRYKPAK